MNETKATYLHRIRSESAYPWFRRIIGIISSLVYGISAAVLIIGFLIPLITKSSWMYLLPCGGISVILLIVGMLIKETCSVVADIADSITDLNSRYEQ